MTFEGHFYYYLDVKEVKKKYREPFPSNRPSKIKHKIKKKIGFGPFKLCLSSPVCDFFKIMWESITTFKGRFL